MSAPRILSAALLFAIGANAHAAEARYVYDVDFAYQNGLLSKSVCREDSVTLSNTCLAPDYSDDASRFSGIWLPKPAGATTQYLTFKFYADNYFGTLETTDGHFAFAVRGSVPPDRSYAEGRGIVIGDTSATPNGCASGAAAQVESFWRGGNMLFSGTCSNGMRNGVWYSVTLSASDNRTINYSVRELVPYATTQRFTVVDPNNNISPDLSRWWMAHVFWPQRNWSVSIMDIRNGWN